MPTAAGVPQYRAGAGDEAAMANWRGQARKALLKARIDMPLSGRIEAERSICQFLTKTIAPSRRPRQSCIGFYWPVQGEIDVRGVMADHIAKGGAACLPVVVARHQPMVFHSWTPQTEMMPGFAGIAVPAASAAGVPVLPVLPDVIIAPVVGFDEKGYRLGYGGGFFDRTLAAFDHRPLVVGVGFAHAELKTIFPHRYDVPMDVLITEKGVRHFS
ncbi:hypothetical protein TMES_18870 [Thalassospira mesophila]|uniref:5-formyltetrahydrofolate cyclo-ligase n=1 Tax=Thalassospira mesophila TaxID=1293891 RepID=A0A1Y2KW77_9PROT|nr:hypothetical protein TMES_18870 [Thalassospira mesophila]